jgi:hypothetical protein
MKAKFVNEKLEDILKPRSQEEIFKDAEKEGQLGRLHGWFILTGEGSNKEYLQDYEDFDYAESIKFTKNKDEAYHFMYYQQAIFIAKMLDHKYFRCIDTAKVVKSNISESLNDILKPKSQEEINKIMSKLYSHELWDYYLTTKDEKFLDVAIKKGLQDIHPNEEEIADVLDNWKKDLSPFIPLIIPYLNDHNDFKISKTKLGYNVHFNYWDDFSCFFEDNSEITTNDIKTIISGEDPELFQQYYDSTISDIHDLGNIFDHIPIANELQKLLVNVVKNEGKDLSKLKKWKDGFEYLFNYILEHKNDIELKGIISAICYAYNVTQAIADEDKARDELIGEIQEYFGFDKKPKIGNEDLYVMPISKENLIVMFKISLNRKNGISYHPPSYGWMGDIEKYGDVFNEELSNRLDDIEILNESLGNILKPKSKDEILTIFINLSISNQVEFLELEDYNNKKIIPQKHWPLIMKIKEKFKKDFFETFRVTYIDLCLSKNGVNFRIYPRERNRDPIRIDQYDSDADFVRVREMYTTKIIPHQNRKPKRVETYQEFLKWFNEVLSTKKRM